MSIINKAPFVMYPINKQDKYSYYENSPEINFEWANNLQRILKSNTLRLCGRIRIMNETGDQQLPANRFDVASGDASTTVQSYEEVCYLNERIGVNAVIGNVTIGSLDGSTFEQVKHYNRIVANTVPSHYSYEDLCSYGGLLLSAYPNNDHISRAASGEIEFCLPLMTGFLQSNETISLERGLCIKLGLAADAMALLGLSAQNYVYELYDLAVIGDYLELSEPVKMGSQDYASYHTFNNVINSSNTHNNVSMNLSAVANIFQSFLPSVWTNNTSYDSFSLCKIMNDNGDGLEKAGDGVKIVTFNRGAIRYPNAYEVDERIVNSDASFQAVRSRHFLNAITPYYNNKHVLISPETEQIQYMTTARSDYLKTPQAADGGLLKRWVKKGTGLFERNGATESSKYVYGVGVNLDALGVRSFSNYANSTFNYSLTSDLDNTSTQVYIFATGLTELETNKVGQIISVS